MASRLADIQQALQADILNRTSGTCSRIKVPAGAAAESRLAVYQNAYKLRLAGILEDEYPVLKAFMGEADFYRMADRFIDACPSAHPNARMVSTRLEQFLVSDGRYASQAVIREIAALENAFSCAFDTSDTALVAMADLASFPADRISEMQIVFSPAVALVALSTNAADICAGVWEGAPAPPAETLSETVQMLVWRQDLSSKYRRVEAEEAMLVSEALAGKDFGTLCELAAVYDDAEAAPARVAGYLTAWINAEMVSELALPSLQD
jgi:hypothetical protein